MDNNSAAQTDYGDPSLNEIAGVSPIGTEFASRIQKLRADLLARGVPTQIISGYRSPEQQAWLQQHPQGNPVAPPGGSYHNYGAAIDIVPSGGVDYRTGNAIIGELANEPDRGLTWGGNWKGVGRDPNHIQLGGVTIGQLRGDDGETLAYAPTPSPKGTLAAYRQNVETAQNNADSPAPTPAAAPVKDWLGSWDAPQKPATTNAPVSQPAPVKDWLGSWDTQNPASTTATPPVAPQGQPGPDGLIWDQTGGHDPKTGSLIVAGKPFSSQPTSQAVAATSGVASGIPVLGAYLPGLASKGAAAANALINGAPYQPEAFTAAQQASEAAYPGTTTAGQIAGGIGGSALAMSVAPAAFGVSRLGLGLNTALAGGSGAALNALDEAARGGSLSDVEKAGMIGGAFGLAGPVAGKAIGGAARMFGNGVLGTLDSETAQLAQAARDKYGIPINIAQLSPSSTVKTASATLNRLPFSGAAADTTNVRGAFNNAVAREIGETTNGKLTSQVWGAARDRIGNDFDTVANNTTIQADQKFQNDLLGTLLQAQQEVSEPAFKKLNAIFDNVVGKIGPNGTIDGPTYQAITRTNTQLGRAIDSADPDVSHWASEIKNVFDDALERSAPQNMRDLLTQARTQYRNLMVLKPLVAESTTGDISPAKLITRLNSQTGNALAFPGGGGNLGELARIGSKFLREPGTSNTAENAATISTIGKLKDLALGAMGLGGLGEIGMHLGVTPEQAIVGAAGLPVLAGVNRLASGALRSKGLANALINRSLNAPSGIGSNALAQSLIRGYGTSFLPSSSNVLNGR